MADGDDDDDKVGYRRPPRKHQFKPGQSGNPKGRPKGSLNYETLYEKGARFTRELAQNGRRLKISQRELTLMQLWAKASSGNLRAIGYVLNEEHRLSARRDPSSGSPALSAEEKAGLEDLIARIRQAADDTEDES